MIGTKFYKDNYDPEEYTKCADWCNAHSATIIDQGEYWEVVALPEPTLEEVKEKKTNELKQARDNAEVQPIEYNGDRYDYDDKARERISAAIVALDGTSLTLSWTTADNTEATVSADDLKAIIRAVATRSNELHVKYRQLKEQVEQIATVEEVEKITWEG